MSTGTAAEAARWAPRSLRWQLSESRTRSDAALAWWAPRGVRWLMVLIPALFWAAALIVIEGLSYVPGLAPHDADRWRFGLGIPAVLVFATLVVAGPRLSERRFQQMQLAIWLLSAAVNFTVMMITPARPAVLADLLATTLATGLYFLPRVVFWQLSLLTAIALSTLVFKNAHGGPTPAWLVVYLPVMWALGYVVSTCRFGLNRSFLEAEEQARTDPLTGLANLRHLREALDEGFRPDGRAGGLLLLDIDHFKAANTLHGHAGGDRALRAVADALEEVALEEHTVARVGGDEIAVFVPRGGEDELRRFARVYRRAVRGANARLELPGLELNASVGVACRPRDGIALADLLAAADRSLYDAKERTARRRLAVRSRDGRHADVPPVIEVPDVFPAALAPRIEDATRARRAYARRVGSAIAVAFAVALVAVVGSGAQGGAQLAAAAICLAGIAAGAGATAVAPDQRVLCHPLLDVAWTAALVALVALTGGVESPLLLGAVALTLLLYSSGGHSPAAWRLALPEIVLLSPLAYQAVFSGPGAAPWWALLVALLTVVAGLTVALILTERLGERIVEDTNRVARRDPLTGLANRRVFEAQLARHLARGHEFAVVMIDLDSFGAVNEVHGHQTGDALLCDIADALRAVVRNGDCLARVGGDEFAAILVGVGPTVARPLAECFVAAVADYTRKAADGTIACVTASAGFSLHPRHGANSEELLARADESLMRVKLGGSSLIATGDRVAMAG